MLALGLGAPVVSPAVVLRYGLPRIEVETSSILQVGKKAAVREVLYGLLFSGGLAVAGAAALEPRRNIPGWKPLTLAPMPPQMTGSSPTPAGGAGSSGAGAPGGESSSTAAGGGGKATGEESRPERACPGARSRPEIG